MHPAGPPADRAKPHLTRRVVAITRRDRPKTPLTTLMLEIARAVAR
jgi:hypothetical protein